MLLIILLICNIPTYVFIAWVVFDSPDKPLKPGPGRSTGDAFYEALVTALKTYAFGVNGDTFNLFPMISFLVACGLAVFGEYYLLQTYVFGQPVFPG
ncbi:hypothetical protein GC197_11875 [bacterium]|nr:hypothetical protein [bacterium]